jgi:hypothetical protein
MGMSSHFSIKLILFAFIFILLYSIAGTVSCDVRDKIKE